MILNLTLQTLGDGAASARLTPTEARIMAHLFRVYPEGATRDDIVSAAWPMNDEPDDAEGVVRVLVHRIRAKAKIAGLPRVIGTVWGSGFVAISAGEIVTYKTRGASISDALLEDIAGLLDTHPDQRRASRVLAALPAVA
jgi:DNA-binding winged helix-turn-helix (wHTH) protein